MDPLLTKGIIKTIEKKYGISLANEKANQILSSYGFFDSVQLIQILDTLQEANPTLLDAKHKGVETVIYLTEKYSPQNLYTIFSTLKKEDLVNPEIFKKFTDLLNHFEEEKARESFIKIFDYFAWKVRSPYAGLYNASDLTRLLKLQDKSDNAIIQLQRIIEKLPPMYAYSNAKYLLSLDDKSFQPILAMINILSNENLLSDKHLITLLNQRGQMYEEFYSSQGHEVHYKLLFAFKKSNLLTQYNLEQLQSLKSLADRLPDDQKEVLTNWRPLAIAISNFIPAIIELSHQKQLNQPLLDILISAVKNMLNPNTAAEEKTNMVNAFFEGTAMTISPEASNGQQRVNEDLLPPPYKSHCTFPRQR